MGTRLMVEIALAAIAASAVFGGLGYRARNDPARRMNVLRLAAAAYGALLVVLVLYPFHLPSWVPSDRYLNPIPFATIGKTIIGGLEWPAARFLVGNVVAFMPVGLLVPLLTGGRASLPLVLGAGAGVSLVLELAQLSVSLVLGYPYRHADVDDVILNTTGTLLGFMVFVAAQSARDGVSRADQR